MANGRYLHMQTDIKVQGCRGGTHCPHFLAPNASCPVFSPVVGSNVAPHTTPAPHMATLPVAARHAHASPSPSARLAPRRDARINAIPTKRAPPPRLSPYRSVSTPTKGRLRPDRRRTGRRSVRQEQRGVLGPRRAAAGEREQVLEAHGRPGGRVGHRQGTRRDHVQARVPRAPPLPHALPRPSPTRRWCATSAARP